MTTLLVGAPFVLSGCAQMAQDARARDLCTQYTQVVTTATQLREQDLAQAKADDLRARADLFRDQLNQVQAAADGRLDTAITNLESSLDDLRQGAIEAGDDVRSTVLPLWKDDLEQVAQRWSIVQEAVARECAG